MIYSDWFLVPQATRHRVVLYFIHRIGSCWWFPVRFRLAKNGGVLLIICCVRFGVWCWAFCWVRLDPMFEVFLGLAVVCCCFSRCWFWGVPCFKEVFSKINGISEQNAHLMVFVFPWQVLNSHISYLRFTTMPYAFSWVAIYAGNGSFLDLRLQNQAPGSAPQVVVSTKEHQNIAMTPDVVVFCCIIVTDMATIVTYIVEWFQDPRANPLLKKNLGAEAARVAPDLRLDSLVPPCRAWSCWGCCATGGMVLHHLLDGWGTQCPWRAVTQRGFGHPAARPRGLSNSETSPDDWNGEPS